MRTWEYRLLVIGESLTEDAELLNRLDRDGWEVLTHAGAALVLRRRMPEVAAAAEAPKTTYPPGLYRIFWKSGGSSLAAVGTGRDGTAWLAPVDWAEPAASWWGVADAERVEVPRTAPPEPRGPSPAESRQRPRRRLASRLRELTGPAETLPPWKAAQLSDPALWGRLVALEVRVERGEGEILANFERQRTSRQSTSTSIDPGEPPTGSASTIASSSDP